MILKHAESLFPLPRLFAGVVFLYGLLLGHGFADEHDRQTLFLVSEKLELEIKGIAPRTQSPDEKDALITISEESAAALSAFTARHVGHEILILVGDILLSDATEVQAAIEMKDIVLANGLDLLASLKASGADLSLITYRKLARAEVMAPSPDESKVTLSAEDTATFNALREKHPEAEVLMFVGDKLMPASEAVKLIE